MNLRLKESIWTTLMRMETRSFMIIEGKFPMMKIKRLKNPLRPLIHEPMLKSFILNKFMTRAYSLP